MIKNVLTAIYIGFFITLILIAWWGEADSNELRSKTDNSYREQLNKVEASKLVVEKYEFALDSMFQEIKECKDTN